MPRWLAMKKYLAIKQGLLSLIASLEHDPAGPL